MTPRAKLAYRAAAFLAVAPVLAVTIHFGVFLTEPPSREKDFREILIAEGDSFRAVAQELESLGIVSDADSFVAVARVKGVTRRMKTGFYLLNTSMLPLEVLDYLVSGRIIEYQIVIPEGYNLYNIAELLERDGIAPAKEFIARATDPEYLATLGINANSLEGYLFPDTYFVPKGIDVDGVIRRLVSKFNEVFNEDLRERAAQLGMTVHEAVTLASLIETEAMVDDERFLISAVYHNRLRRGMLLQCDPTVIYAMRLRGTWNGNITRSDLKMKDPYNTYVYPGLPPGPIANPGKPSLVAALNPADVDYIFFVSKGDGTHFFSSKLSEHNRAVMEYQVKSRNRTETPGGGTEGSVSR